MNTKEQAENRLQRNLTIVRELIYDGSTLQEVADKHNLSRERVRQIANKVDSYSDILKRRREKKRRERQQQRKAFLKHHKDRFHPNGRQTGEYRCYANMLRRVQDTNNPMYPRYGGAGVTICRRWLGPVGFEDFLRDMGKRPPAKKRGRALYSIHRVDGAMIYSKWTCKWATQKEQCAKGQRGLRAFVACPCGCNTKALRIHNERNDENK